MEYGLEQIMNSCENYQEICELFFELARDNEVRINLENILYNGKYKDSYIDSKMMNRGSSFIEAYRRISMADLLVRNPETFEELFQNQIKLFHGTNSNALPSILKYGLNSAFESEKKGIYVATGEKSTRIGGARIFVSFTDVLDIAEDYSGIKPEANANLSFGIVIGTTVTDVLQAGKCIVPSDIPEVGVKYKLPKEGIKTICVPPDKVEFVKKIVNNDEIKVLAMNGLNEKFYYFDIDFQTVHISYDRFNKLKEELQEPKNNKFFKLEEIKNVMLKRLPNIITNLANIKSSKTGGEKDHDGRTI